MLSCTKRVITCVLVFACCACSSTSNEQPQSYLADGSIMISRPAPAPAAMEKLIALGLLPSYEAENTHWLRIDPHSQTISLMEDGKPTLVSQAQGTQLLHSGRFQLLHKQRNPLWYAPASYFEQRNLPVPPEGDKSRFRRGALGDFVLYLTKDTPIHSGPVWSEDVGGVKVDDSSLSKIYYMLPVGAIIEVK